MAMAPIDAARIASTLSEAFGLALAGDLRQDVAGLHIRLRPVELAATQGFIVDSLLGWRRIEVRLQLANFASALLRHMQAATPQQRVLCGVFAETAVSEGAELRMLVSGAEVDPRATADWPAAWSGIEIELKRSPVVIDLEEPAAVEALVVRWAGHVLGMAIALMPVEEENQAVGQYEGAVRRVELDRYERSRLNRAACIRHFGAACQVCGFEFGSVYGPIGDGFIEVHHLEPLSEVGHGRIVNPITDLVPVCSNCHRMLHRQQPPLTPSALGELVADARRLPHDGG